MKERMSIIKEKLILIVIGTLKGLGGAERQAVLLAENLKKSDYKVKIVSFSGGIKEKLLKEKETDYVIFPFKPYHPFKKNIIHLIRLTVFLRALKPYALIPFITLNSKYIGLIWKLTGARFACWNQRDEGREIFGSRLEKLSAGNVPVIISNSMAGKDALISKLKIEPEKIHIINNGIVVPDKISNDGYWRNHLGLSVDTILVSMIASIYRYKDHTTLLKAWKIVSDYFIAENKKAVLIMAGMFKGMEDKLKILAFDLRIADTVFFTGETGKTNELIVESDLVVHSSNTEGCPNAVLEAMALKKTVVGTDIPGMRQALGEKYKDICLSMPKDPNSLASKIIGILKDKVLLKEISDYNHDRIIQEFSVDQMVDGYLDVIDKYCLV